MAFSRCRVHFQKRDTVPDPEAHRIIAISIGCGLAVFALGLIVVYRLHMRRHFEESKKNAKSKMDKREPSLPRPPSSNKDSRLGKT